MPVLMVAHESAPTVYAEVKMLDLHICDAHKIAMVLEEVLGDEGWCDLRRAFADAGRVEPTRSLTRLSWCRHDAGAGGMEK